MIRRALLLLLGLWALATAAVAPPVPQPPLSPPPPLALPARNPPPGAARLQLESGWTALSFPLARLAGLQGLSFCLYRQTPEGCVAVSELEGLDTSLGYWAYSPRPVQLVYWGERATTPRSSTLFKGWNLLGCPSPEPLELAHLSLTLADPGPVRTVAQAAGDPQDPWLASPAYQVTGAFALSEVDLARGGVLRPGQALWVYCYQALELRWEGSQTAPRVSSVSDQPARPGQMITLTGSELDRVDGLTLQGLPIPDVDILSRGAQEMTVRLPDWATTGQLVPYQGTRPLAPVSLRVDAPDPLNEGLLMGQVEDPDGQPLPGARVELGGRQALTGPDGRFYLAHLPTGAYPVTVEKEGFRPGSGQVAITPGKLARLLTTLTWIKPPPERKARLFVTVYPFQLEGRRFWVRRVRIWEVGDYHRRATENYYLDAPSRLVDWGDARLGSRVRVEITWVDGRGYERFEAWDRRIWKDWQHEFFYSPWD
ncbi:MAG: hypothetical protein AMXMBFR33_56630 [Candidatus Xenobia bacterium]